MKIQHSHRRQDDGRIIPVTLCSYADADGIPMAASLHGHLHLQIVERMLGLFRASDVQQAKFSR